ncbi:hypothetical protein [Lentzea sp. NPDC059081]|uniref:hypothetical protein n=1 Tax=Lentzea sp. NPDC059081 TaxID=3346719 RepID=UPI0036A08BC8
MTAAEYVPVSKIVERLGGAWPTTDQDSEPRHLLEEPEPVPGELAAFWFGATPTPHARHADEDEPPALVRQYVLPPAERNREKGTR